VNQTEWLKWRKGGITGTDAAVLAKRFPFGKTPLMLYNEKLSPDIIQYDNPAMAYGRENENRALDWFEKKMGCILFRQIHAENGKMPWLRATIDGIDMYRNYMVEAKCPFNLENHEAVKKSKQVPYIYYPQCQHQMKAMELDGMHFLSYNVPDPDDSIILEVPRNDKFIEELLPEYEKFRNCLQNRIPPELTEHDFFCMEEDEKWQELSKAWRDAKQWAEKAEDLRQELIELSQGRNSQGCGVRVTHSECDGHIDYEAIPELIGVDKEAYRKPSYMRTSVRPIKD